MADVFISYSRKDIAFAKKLHAGLGEADLDIWIDWEDIPPSADWMEEIQGAIEGSDAFIFIISARSANSKTCSGEVTFAAENNKRLIPIVIDDIAPGDVPPFVAALNWIFFREEDDFDTSLTLLLEAIHTDQAWVKAHTRYQTRALEWDRSDRAAAFRLHGSDIEEAERWLTGAEGKDPSPTELQRAYILASRQARTRNQRLVFSGLAGVLVLALGLSAVAFLQRGIAVEQSQLQATAEARAVNEAQIRATAEAVAVAERDARAAAVDETEIQRNIALSQYLASESMNLSSAQLDMKLILSAAAAQFYPGVEAKSSLLEALMAEPHFNGFIMHDVEFTATSIAIHPHGTLLAVGSDGGEIRLLDVQSGRGEVLTPLVDPNAAVNYLVFSGDGSMLVSSDQSGQTWLWALDEDQPEEKDLSAFPGWVDFRAINTDGSEVAGLASSGAIAIWDSNSEDILVELEDSHPEDKPLVFSPQGKYLAAFHSKESIRFWKRSTGEYLTKVNLPDFALEPLDRPPLNAQYSLAFHPQDKGILFGIGHHTYYWDFKPESIPAKDPSILIGFNDSDEPLAFSIEDKTTFQWRLTEKTLVEQMGGRDVENLGPELEIGLGGSPLLETILGVVWSPVSGDVYYLFPGDGGGTVIAHYSIYSWNDINLGIVDSENYQALAHVPGAEGNLMIAAGCAELAGSVGCNRGKIQFWGGEEWDPVGEPILVHQDWISDLVISPDGEYFATASQDNTVQIWDLAKRKPLGEPIAVDFIGIDAQLGFHPKGDLLALYDGWDRIYFLDPEAGVVLGEPFAGAFPGEMEALRHFAFSPDGERMTVVHVGDPISEEVYFFDVVDAYYTYYRQYALNPDGEYRKIDHDRAILAMWEIADLSSPKLLFQVDLKDSLSSERNLEGFSSLKDFYPVAYHPSRSIVAVGTGGSAYLVDADTGKILYSPSFTMDLANETGKVAFSPDGKMLAVADTHGNITLHDAVSGVRIGPSLWGRGRIQDDIEFSPDNGWLFLTFHDEDISLWEVGFLSWLERVCQRVQREPSLEEWEIYMSEVEPTLICPPDVKN
ncbi:MAG: toll/interleukin-1 receptor domain-containing protein [Anaerolineales bacterium]